MYVHTVSFYVHKVPDLRKATFHTHNSRTHCSPSNDSCTQQLINYNNSARN